MSSTTSPSSPTDTSSSSLGSPRSLTNSPSSPWGNLSVQSDIFSVQMDSPISPPNDQSNSTDKSDRMMEIINLRDANLISQVVDEIVDLTGDFATLFIDVRAGEPPKRASMKLCIGIIQFHIGGSNRVYQVGVSNSCGHGGCECEKDQPDIFRIKGNSLRGSAASSFKDILESTAIKKIFYDMRFPAFVLAQTYGIHLRNAYDLQFLGLAASETRYPDMELVEPLSLAAELDTRRKTSYDLDTLFGSIFDYLGPEHEEWTIFNKYKYEFEDAIERGHNFKLWRRLANPSEEEDFWSTNVQLLPKLMSTMFEDEISEEWLHCVEELSKIRIQRAQQLEPTRIWNRPHLESLTL